MYQVHKNVRPGEDSNTSDECIANLAEKCEANYLKLTVVPTGDSYAMNIPATGYRKVFQTKTR
jgi:hypothetical protein